MIVEFVVLGIAASTLDKGKGRRRLLDETVVVIDGTPREILTSEILEITGFHYCRTSVVSPCETSAVGRANPVVDLSVNSCGGCVFFERIFSKFEETVLAHIAHPYIIGNFAAAATYTEIVLLRK